MISDFGATTQGKTVQSITLERGALLVTVLSLGAILHRVRLQGYAHSLTYAGDNVQDYETHHAYSGSVIGPVANRISGANALIAETRHHFAQNHPRQSTLHSGPTGFQHQIWTITDADDTSVTLALRLPDGIGGFPGNRSLTASYSLYNAATLRLDLSATSDAPTIMNPCNHSYWNLDGGQDWAGHRLKINAAEYLPSDDAAFPTGEIAPCANSPYDFRQMREIAPKNPPLDNNFCLSRSTEPLRPVAQLCGKNGLEMQISTTAPGLQIYDGRHQGYNAIAIEPQFWPDATQRPHFPDITLAANTLWQSSSTWQFRSI